MRRLRSRLSYANVVASLALFVALGGSSYAALALPRNSVGHTQIRRSAVTSLNVRDHTLLRKDFRRGQLVRGPRGHTGPQGAQGAQGAQGPVGTPDTSQFFTRAETDARFVQGAGRVVPIPVLDLPNAGSGTLLALDGVGTLEVTACATANVGLRWTNASGAAQDWVALNGYHGRTNVPADSGTVGNGAAVSMANDDARDIIRFSVSGPHPTTFQVAVTRTSANHCVLWGTAGSG